MTKFFKSSSYQQGNFTCELNAHQYKCITVLESLVMTSHKSEPSFFLYKWKVEFLIKGGI